jgi:hypothetical protein
MKNPPPFRGVATILVVLALLLSAPPPAKAALPTIDIPNLIQNTISAVAGNLLGNSYTLKEFGLDSIAWAVSKAAVASMTQSMVNWINSGFNGSPAFVTNVSVYLSDVGFATENTFINQLSSNLALSSPFQSTVAALLNVNYLRSSASNSYFLSNPYTLNQVSSNPLGFVNGTTDFTSGGGWDAWFSLTTQSQNNVYGSYFLAQDELNSRLSASRNNSLTQLGWGQGFLSWCDTSASGPVAPTQVAAVNFNIQGGGSGQIPAYNNPNAQIANAANSFAAVNASASNNEKICTNSDGTAGTIKTPGSVIQAQINKTLGLSGDQLVTADEFNEIIGALIGQLVNQVVGPTGLLGVGSPSSGGNGYVDQAVSQATNTAGASAVSAGTTLSNGITDQIQQVTQYQSNWQSIGNEAANAQTVLNSCSSAPAGASAAISNASSQAAAGNIKANSAIAALSQIRTEVTNAGNSTTAIAKATSDYQALTSSANMPSASEMANVAAQTTDNSTGATSTTTLASLSLFGQMHFIENSCLGH